MTSPKADILLRAKELGFDRAGVASPDLAPHHEATFQRWIEEGCHGEMGYLERRVTEPRPLDVLLPGVQSVLALAVNYHRGDEPAPEATHGQVSRYAVTRDYHKIISKKLRTLSAYIEDEHEARTRFYVDTGPVLERAFAESAGLGYAGKNSMIITKPYGSWAFLAVIMTTLDLEPDENELSIRCGSCTRCIDACPTNAIRDDLTVDARLCISYLTIENRGPIPEHLREPMGNWLFGCDICQEVCPHNHRAQPAKLDDFHDVYIGERQLPLTEILAIRDHDEMIERFAGTPLMRAKRRGLIRNACVVAGNSGDPAFIPHLQALIEREDDEMLIEHAGWAIRQLG